MKTILIHTTQYVGIEYRLAGLGERIAAFFIDFFAFLSFYVLGFFLFYRLARPDLSDIPDSVFLFFVPMALYILYHFLSESFWSGQTLGKKLLRLRVLRVDGEEPTNADHLIRALFQLPDNLLSLGVAAVVLISGTERSQRLGDMVANTTVIKTASQFSYSLNDILSIASDEDYTVRYPEVRKYSDEDMLVVKECLQRQARYRNGAHTHAVTELARRLQTQLGIETEQPPREFLERVLRDYVYLTR
jgi:uncharacterized RDD family membrane protein YckC